MTSHSYLAEFKILSSSFIWQFYYIVSLCGFVGILIWDYWASWIWMSTVLGFGKYLAIISFCPFLSNFFWDSENTYIVQMMVSCKFLKLSSPFCVLFLFLWLNNFKLPVFKWWFFLLLVQVCCWIIVVNFSLSLCVCVCMYLAF